MYRVIDLVLMHFFFGGNGPGGGEERGRDKVESTVGSRVVKGGGEC